MNEIREVQRGLRRLRDSELTALYEMKLEIVVALTGAEWDRRAESGRLVPTSTVPPNAGASPKDSGSEHGEQTDSGLSASDRSSSNRWPWPKDKP